MVRDAERLPWRPVSDRAIKPPHMDVWIRVEGEWRRGWIVHWDRDEQGRRVFIHHEVSGDRLWTWHTSFRWDPETILRREVGEDPPGCLHANGPAGGRGRFDGSGDGIKAKRSPSNDRCQAGHAHSWPRGTRRRARHRP